MSQSEMDAKMRILLAAKQLFAEQGFDGTSVRQICEKAGANSSLISYYFGGKENVFFALLDQFYPTNKLGDPENIEILKHPVEGVKLFIREVLRFKLTDPEMHIMIHQEIAIRSPRIEGLKPYLIPYWEALKGLLERGKKEGIFQFDSMDTALSFVMGTVIFPKSNFLETVYEHDQTSMEGIIEETTRFVLRGLGVKEV